MVNAKRTNGPFFWRRLTIKFHPFQMEREPILKPMLKLDKNQNPRSEMRWNDEKKKWNRVNHDVNRTDEGAFGLGLHPIILKKKIPNQMSNY